MAPRSLECEWDGCQYATKKYEMAEALEVLILHAKAKHVHAVQEKRGDVKLDNSPAWDRNLTGTLQTARVISVTTTSEVAPGKRNPSRGARVRCASMTWKNPVTQGLPGTRQLTKLLIRTLGAGGRTRW